MFAYSSMSGAHEGISPSDPMFRARIYFLISNLSLHLLCMKREEITSVIDHTAHENEAIAHLGNTVQSILLMIIQETLKNVMGGGGPNYSIWSSGPK
jgi:hypothetical protein